MPKIIHHSLPKPKITTIILLFKNKALILKIFVPSA